MAGVNFRTGSQLLLNSGGGHFTDITDSSGVRGLRAFTAAALDYDGDGWVDFVSSARITSYNVCYTKLLRIQELGSGIEAGLRDHVREGVVAVVAHQRDS